MSDVTSKLHDALSAAAVDRQTDVATMMLDIAKTKRDQAIQSMDEIGQTRKLFNDKQQKLLRNGHVLNNKCSEKIEQR